MATSADYERFGVWAVMKNPDANIDRHKCTRVTPMEVLSLGMSRTGTASMHEAYNMLGYAHPYHYSSIFENVQDADMWMEAFDAKFNGKVRIDWRSHFDKLLGHCGAVTDNPCACFWKELLEAYPDAKVVLVERDVDAWLPSCNLLLEGVLNPFSTYVLRYTDPFWIGKITNCGRGWIRGIFGTTNVQQAKKNARMAYKAHYEQIRAAVPREKLLEYQLGSGWEPLCKFLGKPVPDVPFPRRNEAMMLKDTFSEVISRALKRSLINVALVTGVVVTVGRFIWR